VIDAAIANGIKRIVKLSASGADNSSASFAAQHDAVENHLRECGIRRTFVRPTCFVENLMASSIPISFDSPKLGSLQERTIEKGITRVAMPGVQYAWSQFLR
jgi:hypothetical protein